jgi:Stage II sporulation protein E (SpoIIE)
MLSTSARKTSSTPRDATDEPKPAAPSCSTAAIPRRCWSAPAGPPSWTQPEPAPPLGLGPRPEPLRLRLALGDRILLYTDGVSEARTRGAFFPLQAAAAFALVSADLEAGLESLWAELQRHVAGQLHDDVALLLIERSS